MTVFLPEELLESIGELKSRLGDELGLDPDGVPAYQMPLSAPYFPELADGLIDAIERGEDMAAMAKTIDHTILKPEAEPGQIKQLCLEAIENEFCAVCVNGAYVAEALSVLGDSRVGLAAVVGFPLGMMETAAKAFEAKLAVEEGASEIDMVLNVGLLKAGRRLRVFDDICEVVCASGVPVKVILETCLLNDEEKIIASHLSRFAGAAFIKTSTGFSTGGASERDVAIMRAAAGEDMGVKASGGIRDLETAVAMLRAGANRLGSSSGVKIVSR